jgi:DNA-binding transcriptional LysR family regulator
MELRHLRYFVAVAEEANFTRASVRLRIAQPPLSQQVRALEEELDVRLFNRSSRGVVMTAAGRAFFAEAKATLECAQRAQVAARRGDSGETGTLKLAYTGTACFHPCFKSSLQKFRQRYPDVALVLKEGVTTELINDVTLRMVDVAFIRPGAIDFPEVQTKHLAAEEMVAVLPTGHPLARRSRIPLRALAKESFLLFPRRVGPGWFDELTSACRKAGFEPKISHEVPQLYSVGILVAAGMGVSIVPEFTAKQVHVLGVRYVKLIPPSPKARMALVARKSDDSPVVRNFLSMLG